MIQKTFERTEKKYLITKKQYDKIIDGIKDRTYSDPNKDGCVMSLYFDTPDNLLIRRSMDKPTYKEKLRLRSYRVPSDDTCVFIELKKKYKKTVYKRRAAMDFADACSFLSTHIIPGGYESQCQILSEIKWCLDLYDNLSPSILISCDRTALLGIENSGLRITFDEHVTYSDFAASHRHGSSRETLDFADFDRFPVLKDDLLIMEIKIPSSMPLWLSNLLSENDIYPTSFSKVATAYKDIFQRRH